MSWLGDLLAAMGQGAAGALDMAQSGAERAMDEGDALMSGFAEETFNPNNRSSFNRAAVDRMNMLSRGMDPSRITEDDGGETQLAASFIDAPLRAIDRASKYYTGDEIFADRPYMHVPDKVEGSRVLPNLESEAALEDVKTDNISPKQKLQSLRAQQVEAESMRSDEALRGLMSQSKKGTASFAATGDTVSGFDPASSPGGSFSRSLPTVVAQQQVKRLGQLGVPSDVAKLMVDNANGDEARSAIMGLTAKAMVPVQDRVAAILQGAREESAKANNPKEVIKWTVAQLRSAGLSDPQIKLLLMSMAPEQAPQ